MPSPRWGSVEIGRPVPHCVAPLGLVIASKRPPLTTRNPPALGLPRNHQFFAGPGKRQSAYVNNLPLPVGAQLGPSHCLRTRLEVDQFGNPMILVQSHPNSGKPFSATRAADSKDWILSERPVSIRRPQDAGAIHTNLPATPSQLGAGLRGDVLCQYHVNWSELTTCLPNVRILKFDSFVGFEPNEESPPM
jgi:hypothetical protein